MKIALGADHGGAEQKEALRAYLEGEGRQVLDFGAPANGQSVDYPDYALSVARAVAAGEADCGILICGTGIGMAIAANKVCSVHAATVTDTNAARLSRQHNDANVLCLSGRFISPETNREIVDIFLSTDFEGGRHQRRIDKITAAENRSDPL
ncbi:MAG: ribose 5-phosphate isomerase B [Actinomycetia bacterium]|nr:ribose 5-phosphate isomerase B [Actinomycetes bacterium]